ncbi:MaoC family dehydratase [Microbulbifer pacificus]|uniref:MaoC/PaaZ C-terminal domain-containing protein n=1 Tax=Microbulbifer pacificus TaxID=407164 RepID=A0AAU0MZS7_9GAMM|nr:MaoC/PaaZ C-terminal domain-containing protein [Microbulbifer pacificus]WOX05241.1 MaoC/PaaZ C-terminal domain-containing protein [Microbulbifer pacificus]
MPLQFDLNTRPAILPLYFRALTARKPGSFSGDAEQVLASVTLHNQRIDRVLLRTYREVCGFAPGQHLPATYPFVLAMPLQLKLLVSEAFPFPVLGVVHIGNRITQRRPLRENDVMEIRCDLRPPVAVKRGYEFELITSVRVAGDLVWECVSTLLSRAQHQQRPKSRAGQAGGAPDLSEATSSAWWVPADTGRRYASISGDRNPIHLCAPTAKLFGFPRAIAHGMWTKARCLAALETETFGGVLPDSFTLDVAFIKPVFLPAEVCFQSQQSDDTTVFAVTSAGGKRAHLTGTLVRN